MIVEVTANKRLAAWPLCQWTDRMIQLHGFYRMVALLLSVVVVEVVRAAGIQLPVTKLWAEIWQIRKVVNVCQATGRADKLMCKKVLSELTTEQRRSLEA